MSLESASLARLGQAWYNDQMQNASVLVVGDLHFPYHHRDALDFVSALCQRYKPDCVVQIGDETDQHAISYHEHDPDLPSAGEEFQRARQCLWDLRDIIGERVRILESNHGSLVQRKRLTAGLPVVSVKSYRDMWFGEHRDNADRLILEECPKGRPAHWTWHFDVKLPLCTGEEVYFHHGKTANVMKLSQAMGMSAVQGHYHELCGAQYWGTPNGLHFAAQTGCLVDWHSLAMAYAKNNLKRPVLGSLIILDGLAFVVPMVLNNKGRWIRQLPRKLSYVKVGTHR
jgi:hypothetical protein